MVMAKTPHLSTTRGKRVFVTLRTGEHKILKFLDRKDARVLFFDHPPIRTCDIQRMSDYKPKPGGPR
jgi:hypothetical protein